MSAEASAEASEARLSAELRACDPRDVTRRVELLERIAILRRWERRDRIGALDALAALIELRPAAVKAREDMARLFAEVGRGEEAAAVWRAVLALDPLCVEAWRGLLERCRTSRLGDEAFVTASTMSVLGLVQEDITRALRAARPPFPQWPAPVTEASSFVRKVAHPLEASPVCTVWELTAPALLPMHARGLRSVGLRPEDALRESEVPPSLSLAVRSLVRLLGLPESPALYRVEAIPRGLHVETSSFFVLPSVEPALAVAPDVLRSGMTPERAWALGRASWWLTPQARLAASAGVHRLVALLDALRAAFLGDKGLERSSPAAIELGAELEAAVLSAVHGPARAALRGALHSALRAWVEGPRRATITDWLTGVGYTSDRVGLLMAGDLEAALRGIETCTPFMRAPSSGVRRSVMELVLFSVSPAHMELRADLRLALPEHVTEPLLEFV